MADVLRAIFDSDDDISDFEGFSESDIGSDIEADVDQDSSDEEDVPDIGNDDGWTGCFSDVSFDDFNERHGPNLPEDFDVVSARPLDYFLLLFPLRLIEMFVTYTNSYAQWKMQQSGQQDDKWVETSIGEMRAFLGINILMRIQQLPVAEMYWSANPLLGNLGIQRIMPCNRFHKLVQYFHVADRYKEPARGTAGYDRLYKVREVVNAVLQTFRKYYTLSREVAVDEAMIRFAGRLSFKQYMPAKPIKRGIKVWMLCDSNSAYLSQFQVYMGKQNNKPEHGLGHNIVMQLTNTIYNTFRHVYFNNFFTGVPLLKSLLSSGLYACGTVRPNRKEFPTELRKPREIKNRGEFKVLQRGDSNLTASVWKDKKLVYHLSTLSNPGTIMPAQRRIGPQVMQLNQPHCVHSYNRFMGGVDLHDQLRMKYDVGRDSKKWWRYLFWFLVNCSMVNSFILYQQASRRLTKKKRYTHLDFRNEVIMDLIGGYSKRKRSASEQQNAGLVNVENVQGHISGRLPGPKRRCRFHLTQLKERRETSFGCTVCNVHLCRDGCHGRFHNM